MKLAIFLTIQPNRQKKKKLQQKMANLNNIAMLAEIDGILLVDKPSGISSHDVVKTIKHHFNLVKVGHGGTLDPNATGLLIILIGGGTRLSNDLMGGDKAYTGVVRLGRVTDTQDKDGHTLSENAWADVTLEKVEEALKEFKGDIFQEPPMFSAIKVHGEPLYRIARTGEEVERKARLVHVYKIAVSNFEAPLFTLDVSCTKGTYIRTIAHDLGQMLGCGACLEELRRTKSGRFTVDEAMPLFDLLKLDAVDFSKRILPMSQVRVS
jgi:tRNA pseudouridine55 synthase